MFNKLVTVLIFAVVTSCGEKSIESTRNTQQDCEIGKKYFYGDGVRRDLDIAGDYLKDSFRLCDALYEWAEVNDGQYYGSNGREDRYQDYDLKAALHKENAEAGHPGSQMFMVMRTNTFYKAEKDPIKKEQKRQEAIYWFTKALAQQYPRALAIEAIQSYDQKKWYKALGISNTKGWGLKRLKELEKSGNVDAAIALADTFKPFNRNPRTFYPESVNPEELDKIHNILIKYAPTNADAAASLYHYHHWSRSKWEKSDPDKIIGYLFDLKDHGKTEPRHFSEYNMHQTVKNNPRIRHNF